MKCSDIETIVQIWFDNLNCLELFGYCILIIILITLKRNRRLSLSLKIELRFAFGHNLRYFYALKFMIISSLDINLLVLLVRVIFIRMSNWILESLYFWSKFLLSKTEALLFIRSRLMFQGALILVLLYLRVIEVLSWIINICHWITVCEISTTPLWKSIWLSINEVGFVKWFNLLLFIRL